MAQSGGEEGGVYLKVKSGTSSFKKMGKKKERTETKIAQLWSRGGETTVSTFDATRQTRLEKEM